MAADLRSSRSDEPIEPDRVSSHSFGTSFRGFDQLEVRSFLQRVAAELRRLQELEEHTRIQLQLAEQRLEAAESFDENHVASVLGQETAKVIEAARAAAAEIHAKADGDAAKVRQEARDEAAKIKTEAEADAARIRREAEAVRAQGIAAAEADLEAAKQAGREMVAEARHVRERMLKDVAKRRQVLRTHADQLRAARARVLEAYALARRVVEQATHELNTTLPNGGDGLPAVPPAAMESIDDIAAIADLKTTGDPIEATAARSIAIGEPPTPRGAVTDTETSGADVADAAGPTSPPAVDRGGEVLRGDDGRTAETPQAPASVRPAGPEAEADSASAEEAERSDELAGARGVPGAAGSPSGTDIAEEGEHTRSVDEHDGSSSAETTAEPRGSADGADGAETAAEPRGSADGDDTVETSSRSADADHTAHVSVGTDGAEDIAEEVSSGEVVDATEGSDVAADIATVDAVAGGVDADAVDSAAGGVDADAEVGSGVDSADEAEVGADVATVQTVEGDEEPVDHSDDHASIDDLFARLRRAGETPPDVDASEGRASTEETADHADTDDVVEPSSVSVVGTADDVDRDELDSAQHRDWAAQRDRLVDPIDDELTRRLKRVLSDEQNRVLERLRSRPRRQGPPGVDDLLEGEGPSEYRTLINTRLASASSAGVAFTGAQIDEADVPRHVGVGDLANQLTKALVEPIRDRVGDALARSEGDLDAASDLVRAAYRELKVQRVRDLVRAATLEAFGRGVVAATPSDAGLVWLADVCTSRTPDCEDDALAGIVGKGEPFPTGHHHPPIHPGCRCLVVPVAR